MIHHHFINEQAALQPFVPWMPTVSASRFAAYLFGKVAMQIAHAKRRSCDPSCFIVFVGAWIRHQRASFAAVVPSNILESM